MFYLLFFCLRIYNEFLLDVEIHYNVTLTYYLLFVKHYFHIYMISVILLFISIESTKLIKGSAQNIMSISPIFWS